MYYYTSETTIRHTVFFIIFDCRLKRLHQFHLSVKVKVKVKVKVTLRLTVSQPVSLGAEPLLGIMTIYLLLFGSYGLVSVGRPL
jgi:hypothetical protein